MSQRQHLSFTPAVFTIVSGLCTAIAACAPAPVASGPAKEDCSVDAKNEYVQQIMEDAYLWYDKVPSVDAAAYDSPESILDALVYKNLDRWSYVLAASTYNAYYEEGSVLGFGFRWKYDTLGEVRFSLVYPGSPSADADIERGDKLLAINGASIDEIAANDLWDQVLGAEEEGLKVNFTIEGDDGFPVDVVLEKRWYGRNTVHTQKVLDFGANKVGYIFFTNFLETSEADLIEALSSFRAAGVTDMILDLRYNGGGRVEIAELLASLILGPTAQDLAFYKLVHNANHPDWDETIKLNAHADALDLERIFIIVSEESASASETLVNGLRPYIDVTTIGQTTHGKPVGMYTWDYCDFVTVPIAFEVNNALGEGGYYDGLEPDCWAEDLLTVPLGDETETSLAETMHLLQYGTCSAGAGEKGSGGSGAKYVGPKTTPRNGFQMEVGSY